MKKHCSFLMLGCAAIACGGSASMASPPKQADCEVLRILPDGREVRSRGSASSFVQRGSRSAQAFGTAHSSGRASSHSSVSVSSSSSSRGNSRGHARASTSYTDERGHQVTTVRDETGCRVTIDEREETETGDE